MEILSVGRLTRYIKVLFDEDSLLSDITVEGEVSNFTRASSGHCYFSLKDTDAELRCVMWRNQASRLAWLPKQGDHVQAHGYLSVYEQGGAYQLYADSLQRGGIGDRWAEFLRLKERLAAEGLFDESRKRQLPTWPKRIGVVTSPSGAALQDILRVLSNRYPLVEVVLSPSLVQGDEAPAAIVQALGRLNKLRDLDVIIVARGGGAVEDLWAFNDEGVARAIAACHVPVVSGVGHETDFTIADWVADVRAPTPTAAATMVTPDRAELLQQLDAAVEALTNEINDRILREGELVEGQERLLHMYDPRRQVAEGRQRLDEFIRRMETAMRYCGAVRRANLEGIEARLQALGPAKVLSRGYAIVVDSQTGRLITSVAQVSPGQEIDIRIADGKIGAQVQGTSS